MLGLSGFSVASTVISLTPQTTRSRVQCLIKFLVRASVNVKSLNFIKARSITDSSLLVVE